MSNNESNQHQHGGNDDYPEHKYSGSADHTRDVSAGQGGASIASGSGANHLAEVGGGDGSEIEQETGSVPRNAKATKEKGGASEFVKKLYRMLESNQLADTVCWGYSGDSFVVKDMNALTRTVLPLHFKHSNFASFVRQLNKYDFHKVKANEDGTLTYGEHTWEFKHPNFRSDMKSSLENIKRKPPVPRKGSGLSGKASTSSPVETHFDPSSLQIQLDNLNQSQRTMSQHMTTLGHDYQSVIGEMVGFQRNMIAQDQFMQILIQYLVNLEADHKATTTGTSPNSSAPFAPSASAQKLISAYNDLSRASYDQMANLSRRASLSNGALPQIPLPPSTFGRLDVGPSDRFRESSMASTDSRYRETDRFNDSNGNHDNLHQNHNRNRNGMGSGSGLVLPSLGGLESAVQQHQREAQAREYYQREQHRIQQNEQQRQHDQRRQYDQQQRQQQQQHQHQNQQQHQQHQSQHLRPQQQQQPHQQNDRQQHEQQLRVASPANVDHPPLTISLPVVDRKPVLVAGWAVPPRVLLVEDDAVCRKLSAKFLEIFGCEIDVAVDGVSAVNKMNLERYDLVLMDIVMPNLDGVSATSLIRQFDPVTPIISMTSNSGPNEIMTYFSHGMNDILPKPFTKEGLLGMLEKHLTHLKVMQQMAEIPRALGFTDGQIQEAVAVSTVGDEGTVINPFSAMGISDADYIEMLQGIALEKEGKRGLEVVEGNEREGKRARFQEIGS